MRKRAHFGCADCEAAPRFVGIIESLAFHTKILALNAAVERSRLRARPSTVPPCDASNRHSLILFQPLQMPFRFYFNGVQTYIDPLTACVGVNFKKEMKLSFEQMEIDVGTTSANRVKREATRRESV
ncbi:hypothetical protein [Paraburkholderia hospita]|uniref:hypothetical protein n=1 Tax=Paraburkholderia hospita TaxID=169430 RepID=UPI001ABED112|nr:hypothetical protein [Paraburkholderia hospita]